MGKIEEIPDEEIERLARESGLFEKLPPDFVPFEPGVKQRQTAERNAWLRDSDEEDSEDDRPLIDDEDSEDDYGRDEYSLDPSSDPNRPAWEASHQDAISPQVERIFDLVIWTMPFGFLYMMLDIMIHQQYAQHPTFLGEMVSMASATPFLGTFIWFTMPKRGQSVSRLQAALFVIAIASGSSFLWIMVKSDWEDVIRRTPPLGTIWVYCIVRLHLLPACVSLAIVAAFVKLADLKLEVFGL